MGIMSKDIGVDLGTSNIRIHVKGKSVVLEEPSVVAIDRKTGAIVTNLLDKLNISNRAVNSIDEFNKIDYDSEINYEEVNSILKKEREKSLEWLNKAIND